jgi:hypothetical protein
LQTLRVLRIWGVGLLIFGEYLFHDVAE